MREGTAENCFSCIQNEALDRLRPLDVTFTTVIHRNKVLKWWTGRKGKQLATRLLPGEDVMRTKSI